MYSAHAQSLRARYVINALEETFRANSRIGNGENKRIRNSRGESIIINPRDRRAARAMLQGRAARQDPKIRISILRISLLERVYF